MQFPFRLLIYGLRIVNRWFSCRKPMVSDAETTVFSCGKRVCVKP